MSVSVSHGIKAETYDTPQDEYDRAGACELGRHKESDTREEEEEGEKDHETIECGEPYTAREACRQNWCRARGVQTRAFLLDWKKANNNQHRETEERWYRCLYSSRQRERKYNANAAADLVNTQHRVS